MLLGVRPALGDELVRDGHRLRIYTPFGRALVRVLAAAAAGEPEARRLHRRRTRSVGSCPAATAPAADSPDRAKSTDGPGSGRHNPVARNRLSGGPGTIRP